jgi:subtilisin family serine protease
MFVVGERSTSMFRSRVRGRSAVARVPARGLPLQLEILEDRCMLDAGVGSLLGAQAYDPTDILVHLRPAFSKSATFSLTGNEVGAPSTLASGLWKIELNAGETVADALATFRLDPRVDYAQPDYRIQVQTTPNDPYFTSGKDWGLNEIGAPAAWSHTTGSSNVVVAIIDTGIDYTHPDLAANVWTNHGNLATDGIGNDLHGANFTSLTTTTGNVLDDNGHGSHVAGIIGAVGNNGIGTTGVAWHVQLMALKFLDANGSGYTSGAVRAIDYAISHGASIINASWGGSGYDQALADAIGRARQAGIIFVAAAGNNASNDDTTGFYPADYNSDNVVTVAASTSSDQPASFTNYGPHSVDLYAPGVGIWSTVPHGQYASYSGTSMATPFVTGALALLKVEHPDWNYHQLISRLKATVDKLPQFGNVAWGGRLDLAAALADVTPPVTATHPTVTGAIASKPSLGQFYKIRLLFNEAMVPSSFTTADVSLAGPRGSIAVTDVAPVSGTNNTQFDVTFATQTTPGSYRLVVGPHVQDTASNEMTQAYSVTFTVKGSSATFGSGSLNLAVSEFRTTTSTVNVGQDLAVGKLTVNVNLTYPWIGDLVIKLRGPDGTTVMLFNRRGGRGHDLHATFDDAAQTPIANGKAPYNGSYRPEQTLAAFAGKNARGSWQLIVQDQAAGDQGTLTGWSFTLQAGASSASAAHPSSIDGAGVAGRSSVEVGAVDTVFARSLVRFLTPADAPAAPANRAQEPDPDTRPVAAFTTPRATAGVIDDVFASGGVIEENDLGMSANTSIEDSAGSREFSLENPLVASEE